jgi:Fe-S cluster assembly protein SufD
MEPLHNINWHTDGFAELERTLNGESRTPLHALRRDALARFSALGFPTTELEEWRFTNIVPITRLSFTPRLAYDGAGVTQQSIDLHLIRGLDCHLIVFVNGHYAAGFSSVGPLPDGTVVGNLAGAMKSHPALIEKHLARHAAYGDNAFAALNTAFLQEGACVILPEGAVLERPVFVLYLSTEAEEPFVTSPRNLYIAGAGSRAAIIEQFSAIGHATYLTNVVSELVLGRGAVLEHDRIQNESDQAFHISNFQVAQEGGSSFISNAVSFGGSIVRNNITAQLNGEGCDCTLNGLSLATGTQLIDNHTVIDHASPRCVSHELYKAILEGRSRGVFNGKILVRQDAQKTDAKQTNKTLLLSEDAMIDTKPQLEIFADDVKCTHGATVGQLDEEQIFYLRARGLGLDEARDILTNAFASDVIQRMKVEPIREFLQATLHVRLCRGRIGMMKP